MCANDTSMAAAEVNRDNVIIKTSIIGILTNVFLAAFKAVIGIVSNSIAVTLDAVNNLSDALSSIITIVGTKLAGHHCRGDRSEAGTRQICQGAGREGEFGLSGRVRFRCDV